MLTLMKQSVADKHFFDNSSVIKHRGQRSNLVQKLSFWLYNLNYNRLTYINTNVNTNETKCRAEESNLNHRLCCHTRCHRANVIFGQDNVCPDSLHHELMDSNNLAQMLTLMRQRVARKNRRYALYVVARLRGQTSKLIRMSRLRHESMHFKIYWHNCSPDDKEYRADIFNGNHNSCSQTFIVKNLNSLRVCVSGLQLHYGWMDFKITRRTC